MMKKAFTLILFLLLLRGLQAQTDAANPYAEIGQQAKVLTLSRGKYQETFSNDTIQPIGSVLYNRVTGEVSFVVETDTLFSESDLRPEVVSRWLSPDPLADEFANWTPYNYTLDNPIKLVDHDGKAPGDPGIGFGISLSVSFTNSGAYFRGGVSVSVSQNIGSNVSLAAVANGNTYLGGLGTPGGHGFGFDGSIGGAITIGGGSDAPLPQYIGNATSVSSLSNSFKYSGTYGQSLMYSSGLEDSQRNGVIGARIGNVAFSSHNDTDILYFGDGGDRGFSGGIILSAGVGNGRLLEGGTEVYTGVPTRPHGQSYDPKQGIRFYAQGPDKNLNNGMTFLRYSGPGFNASAFSQGKGNLWFQRFIHNHVTKNKLFTEDETPDTEFGAGGGGSN